MNYLVYLTDWQEEMVESLQTVVSYESPSREKALLDELPSIWQRSFPVSAPT